MLPLISKWQYSTQYSQVYEHVTYNGPQCASVEIGARWCGGATFSESLGITYQILCCFFVIVQLDAHILFNVFIYL